MIDILIPKNSYCNYHIPANIFADLLIRTTGHESRVVFEYQGENFTVAIGNDAVNPYTAQLFLEGRIAKPLIRSGGDEYQITSTDNALLIAGGCLRSDIYAIYRYFELFMGCRYFWDGDIIPANQTMICEGVNVFESPRFKYRGIRYFAHRSLHRFQAEHWSLGDWKKEIDWILKKRLNLFMLRIGHDDIFQRAFGDIVDYPDPKGILPEAGPDHDDRTLFWPLEYRAYLRKEVLKYAFERGLIHPEDCGTITHWYSRTPVQYLERRNPPLLTQTTDLYNKATSVVWDVRQEGVMEDYFKLTEAHIKHYGSPQMFHTIGLAERMFSNDRDKNIRLKQYVYHKIQRFISERYPNAPLLIASWDFYYTCKKEEVAEIFAQLDPSNTILFDYTSDSAIESNFTNWDVVGKFPWIFGIFQGLEPNSEIRGDYDLIEKRFTIAANDDKCIGMVLWPEMAHSDTLMTEYLAENSWTPTISFAGVIAKYCRDRYPGDISAKMHDVWTHFVPIVNMHAWDCDKKKKNTTDLFFCPLSHNKFLDDAPEQFAELLQNAANQRQNALFVLENLATLPQTNELVRRDVFDIARTIAGRYLTALYQLLQSQLATANNYKKLRANCAVLLDFMAAMANLLGCHEDYSMNHSYQKLAAVHDINPHFESAYKNNAANNYCRSYIYENARYIYLPEAVVLVDWIEACIQAGKKVDRKQYDAKKDEIRAKYHNTPLIDMAPKDCLFDTALQTIINNIKSIEF